MCERHNGLQNIFRWRGRRLSSEVTVASASDAAANKATDNTWIWSQRRAGTHTLRAAYKQHAAAYPHTDYYLCSVFDIALAQSTARRSSLLAGCDAGANMSDLFSFQ